MTLEEQLAACEKATTDWERYGYIGRSGLGKVRREVRQDPARRAIYEDVPANEHDSMFMVVSRTALPAAIEALLAIRSLCQEKLDDPYDSGTRNTAQAVLGVIERLEKL